MFGTFLLAMAVAIAAGRADDDYPILVYPCPQLDPAPKIDGDLGDACWSRAALVSGFTFYNKLVPAPVQTSLRMGYDRSYLYVAVRCDEPKMRLVRSIPVPRDSSNVFRQEAIELFVDPMHSHKDYYQLAFCPAGSYYDSARTEKAWDSQTRMAARELADSWTLEVAIPWADLGVAAKPGLVVGFNACRDRHVDKARGWTNWSQTKANFHDPVRFGHLVLSCTDEMIGKMERELRKGGRSGELRVFSADGYSRTAYVALARQAVADLDRLLRDLARTAEQEPGLEARRELEKLLAAMRTRLMPYRSRVRSQAALDARQWQGMSQELHMMQRELVDAVWQARLSALLHGL